MYAYEEWNRRIVKWAAAARKKQKEMGCINCNKTYNLQKKLLLLRSACYLYLGTYLFFKIG